jgi:hypothetical protein
MRQFTIAAATVAIAAVFSAAPASAEAIFGGPLQQNGKCWHGEKHSSASEATWGYWGSVRKRRAAPNVEGAERHQPGERRQLGERHQLRRRLRVVGSDLALRG